MRLPCLYVICLLAYTVFGAPIPASSDIFGKHTLSFDLTSVTENDPAINRPTETSAGARERSHPVVLTVRDAWLNKGERLSNGAHGVVHDLPGGFGREHISAVIKQIPLGRRGFVKEDIHTVRREIENLVAVKQYLAWGTSKVPVLETRYESSGTAYIVMKKMGVDINKTTLDPHSNEVAEMIRAAILKYEQKYGMRNGDMQMPQQSNSGHPDPGHNIVYCKTNQNGWKAEIIDWGNASTTRKLPRAPEPENLDLIHLKQSSTVRNFGAKCKAWGRKLSCF